MSSAARNADLPLRPFVLPALKSHSREGLAQQYPGAGTGSEHEATGYDPLPSLRAACLDEPAQAPPLTFARRRRASVEQGRALESLGHAVEYLVDSRMFMLEDHNRASEGHAVQILMKLSRQVFAECAEVVSPWKKLKRLVCVLKR